MPNDWSLKEIVTTLISAAIIGITIYLILMVYTSSGTAALEPIVFQRYSSLLQIVIGLAGTVMGYYFGRIPAENQVGAAQAVARSAQAQLSDTTALATNATADKDRIVRQVTSLKDRLAGISLPGAAPAGGGAPSTVPIDHMIQELTAILSQ